MKAEQNPYPHTSLLNPGSGRLLDCHPGFVSNANGSKGHFAKRAV
jgi:hypothetical protein